MCCLDVEAGFMLEMCSSESLVVINACVAVHCYVELQRVQFTSMHESAWKCSNMGVVQYIFLWFR